MCSDLFGYFQICSNVSKLILIYLNLSEPIQMYPNTSEHIWMYLNLSECIWTYLNVSELIRMFLNVSIHVWIHKDWRIIMLKSWKYKKNFMYITVIFFSCIILYFTINMWYQVWIYAVRFIVTYIPSGTGRNFQWQLILHTWADQTMMGLIGGSHLIQTLLVLQNRNRKN